MNVHTTQDRLLIIMVKRPVAGRVKTRLAVDIGTVAATSFYRSTMRAVTGRLGRDRRWRTVLAVAPDTAVGDRGIAVCSRRIGQGRGDLGARMSRLLAGGSIPAPLSASVLIIGSDIPGIMPRHIWSAFSALRSADAVLGPAFDGGYWLIGARGHARQRIALGGIRWSSRHALADTLRMLEGCRIPPQRIARAPGLGDVDDAADWRQARATAGRVVHP